MPGLQFKEITGTEPQQGGNALCFMQFIVGNRQSLSAFGPSGCQYSSAISSCHALTETVFISSFSLRRLESSFHDRFIVFVVLKNKSANVVF